MPKPEKLSPSFNFPQGIDENLLRKLEERFYQTGSLRVAVAHQIEEEGLLLRDLAKKFFPQDAKRKIAVDEYTFVGTLILETQSALQSGNYRDDKEKHQVTLLKRDPSGFTLLTWWVNLGLEEFKWKRDQALMVGRTDGVKRYKKLYQDVKSSRKKGIST